MLIARKNSALSQNNEDEDAEMKMKIGFLTFHSSSGTMVTMECARNWCVISSAEESPMNPERQKRKNKKPFFEYFRLFQSTGVQDGQVISTPG